MKNFKQYINESNIDIDKIKEECKKLKPNIDYSSSDWEQQFIEKANWDVISIYQKSSEDFIEYFKDNINWYWFTLCQKFSESFIEKYQNYIYWQYISWFQDLSESFIEKNKDKINFKYLFDNKHITNEFILNHIQWFINEDIKKDSWRFKDKEFSDKFNKYKKLFGS